MLFNSTEFLIFFPIVVCFYYIFPQKYRYIWILISSYYFYLSWNILYGLILVGVTGTTYIGARILDGNYIRRKGNLKQSSRKRLLLGVLVACLGVLVVFKYDAFLGKNLQMIMNALHINITIPTWSLILPVGISFYIFQALGYVIDVYRGNISAEKNFLLYAAYISFFPQLVAGPIERASNLIPQFYVEHKFQYSKVKSSLLLMLWGMFMKVVLADRLAIFVDQVYSNYTQYDGWLLIIASILFAFQIYCDFAGYSTIAIGAAGVMGFELMENFRAPYCATGMRDFWSRWHISLTGWFRDYVYIPLGGNKRGRFRKEVNTLVVFLLSGLWHGANWSYVIWGGLNGVYIIIEDLLTPLNSAIRKILRFGDNNRFCKLIGTIVTFVLVDISWVFFRANGTKDALLIFKNMTHLGNYSIFFDNTIHFYLMEKHAFFAMLLFLLILFVIDVLHNHNIHLRNVIAKRNVVVRWAFYIALIMSILIFGVWGPDFDETSFIYFQF